MKNKNYYIGGTVIGLMILIFFIGRNSGIKTDPTEDEQSKVLRLEVQKLRIEKNIALDSLELIKSYNHEKDSIDRIAAKQLIKDRSALNSTNDDVHNVPMFKLWPEVSRQLDSSYNEQINHGYKPYSGDRSSKDNKSK